MNPTQEKNIDFDAIKLSLASPEHILEWSHGEITKPETINYRTQRPEKDGLFCEKIFGPTKDWQCYCGKYKGVRYKSIVCDKCGVLVTRSLIRRERMGHIKLAVPVTHIWFLRGTPSSVGNILDLSIRDLERIVYFANYVVTNVDDERRKKALSDLQNDYKAKRKDLTKQSKKEDSQIVDELSELDNNFEQAKAEIKELNKFQLLSESRYRELNLKYGEIFKASIGAEAIGILLSEIDLKKLSKELNKEIDESIGQKQKKAVKRLKIVEGMISSGIRPEWMVMTALPVIPPDLRPMVELDGGRFAASDLNDLYRRVINRNNRLKKLYALEAPEVICRNEKRMLQEAVDALIDNNARRDRSTNTANARKKLKSLADLLKGKQGRFRQNLLGKRVDFSGRSVIVVGPHLKLDQCGLPKTMALELFKPFVISKLISLGYAHNVKSASRMIERARNEVWDALDEVIADKYVLLNRAPTLHRLGIQAFKPVLIEGKAIQLHPMVCIAFNADFDGDQMAVHVPLSESSQKEAREIMLSKENLLKPSSGEPVVRPDQDIVLGCYFLTLMGEGLKGENKIFSSSDEAIYAYQNGDTDLQAKIKVRVDDSLIETSVGRLLFKEVLPDGISFGNETLNKSALKKVMAEVFVKYGNEITAKFADDIKSLGFRYATKSGISIGIDDLQPPAEKNKIIEEGEEKVVKYLDQYEQGLITNDERYERTVEEWQKVSDDIEKRLVNSLDAKKSSIAMMIDSGARGTVLQAHQMSGMKGLVLNPAGRIIELPIRSNYKEGLSVLEYFISTHGARKGLTDTALKTAGSGYLTRKLVDVSQDVIISEIDCGAKEGFLLTKKEAQLVGEESLAPLVVGRVSAQKVIDPKTKKVIVGKNRLIDDDIAKQIVDLDIQEVGIRSVLKCKTVWGVCQKCYGADLAKGTLVNLGEAVGILAAQSIGEPGTQLTMRTMHSGGVASAGDITQGLPRVEEIFEARNPKGESVLSEIEGVVTIKDVNSKRVIRVAQPDLKITEYKLEKMKPIVKTNDKVKKGQLLATTEDKKRTIKAGANGVVKVGRTNIELTHEGGSVVEYTVPMHKTIEVKNGDLVTKGQKLTEGSINLQDMLRLLGKEAVQHYVIDEVQSIYSSQGQTIASKHIEVIIKQMFSKVMVVEPNDTDLLSGDVVSKLQLVEENERVKKSGKKPAVIEETLLAISKVSIGSESWLSAASFQETTRVLIGAALRGKSDKLRGLKENVIIGRMIPVGTGFRGEDEN